MLCLTNFGHDLVLVLSGNKLRTETRALLEEKACVILYKLFKVCWLREVENNQLHEFSAINANKNPCFTH